MRRRARLFNRCRRRAAAAMGRPPWRSRDNCSPAAGEVANVRPIEVRRAFSTPGSHLVTLRLFAADQTELDRQDLALEVMPNWPVLVIDGDERTGPRRHGVEFLREALAPARDPT